jgi:hypothetical protein
LSLYHRPRPGWDRRWWLRDRLCSRLYRVRREARRCPRPQSTARKPQSTWSSPRPANRTKYGKHICAWQVGFFRSPRMAGWKPITRPARAHRFSQCDSRDGCGWRIGWRGEGLGFLNFTDQPIPGACFRYFLAEACWCAARAWLVNHSAHRCHLSAIRVHVALSSGLCADLAISLQSAACRKNSSGGFIDRSLCRVIDLGGNPWAVPKVPAAGEATVASLPETRFISICLEPSIA